MDPEAKHYRTMKNALWLYLYLLLGANRKTGLLMRKIDTICTDMGVTRDTALRWLKRLRRAGYIETVNTGRSLTIQVMRWKALPGAGKNQLLKSDRSRFSGGKSPPYLQPGIPVIPPRSSAVSGLAAAGNDTKIQTNVINDLRKDLRRTSADRGFVRIGATFQHETLAQELTRRLEDPAGINLYRSYAARYPEWLLRKALAEAEGKPPEQITKGRGALFNYLVQHYAKGVTDNPGH